MDHPDRNRNEDKGHDSDDASHSVSASESLSRRKSKRRLQHPIYSREDIREQYCINTKELEVFEEAAYASNRLFGCLSLTHLPDHSPCNRSSILPNCVKRKNSLDSNTRYVCDMKEGDGKWKLYLQLFSHSFALILHSASSIPR